jgi:rhomboid family GlyGly-CTERM serine protease
MKRLPVLTIIIAGLAIAIHCSHSATVALQFDRDAFVQGEIWRVLTGHLTHFGTDHLRWDLIALLAFGSLTELRSRRTFIACLVTSAVVIPLGVGIFQPQFVTYRGLSGIDSALFGFVTADLLRTGWRDGDKLMTCFGAIALAGFLVKSAYEICTGLTVFVGGSTEFEAVPLAHLLGAATGVICAWVRSARKPEMLTA